MQTNKKINYYRFNIKRYNNRIIFIGIVSTLVFAFFLHCTYNILVGKEYREHNLESMVESQYYYEENIENLNYRVFDTNGKDLIEYTLKYFFVIDPNYYLKYNINKNTESINDVKKILKACNKEYMLPDEMKEEIYKNKIENGKIKYEIDEITYNLLNEQISLDDIKGIYFYSYSCHDDSEAWDIVNMLTRNRDNILGEFKGKNYLESYIYDKISDNEYSKIKISNDIYKERTSELIFPKNNTNVRLTLDKNMQDRIKKILNDNKYADYQDISVILMEANTGKIKALTQKNEYNPNLNLGVASNHGYFPGSIFKVIVEEAGIENKIIKEDDIYNIKISKEDEIINKSIVVEEAFITSSNEAFYKIGEEVGFKNIYELANNHGLLEPVLGLYDEQSGYFELDENNVSLDEVKQASIGQKMRITPIEAISIPNTVINNGIFVKPYILEGFVDDNNNFLSKESTFKKSILKKSTSNILKGQMKDVVKKPYGTANLANIDSLVIGGKTGTTEYFEIDERQNRIKYSDGWFTGFFESKGKKYSMVVLVRNIDVQSEYGGNTAAPIFKEIVKQLIQSNYL